MYHVSYKVARILVQSKALSFFPCAGKNICFRHSRSLYECRSLSGKCIKLHQTICSIKIKYKKKSRVGQRCSCMKWIWDHNNRDGFERITKRKAPEVTLKAVHMLSATLYFINYVYQLYLKQHGTSESPVWRVCNGCVASCNSEIHMWCTLFGWLST